MLKTIFSLFLLFGSFAAANYSQAPSEAKPLIPGQVIERDIAGGESHLYQVSLAAGQFVHVVVEQNDVDVALAWFGSDGAKLFGSDLTTESGEKEPFSFQSKAKGVYQLSIKANSVSIVRGAYHLVAIVTAAASDTDLKRMAAEQVLADAAAMARRKEFQNSIDKRLQALAVWRGLGDRDWEASTLVSIGDNYKSLSRFEQAIENNGSALAIRREIRDRAGEARTLRDIGIDYASLSRFDRSLEYFAQSLAINREIKNRGGEGDSLGWIGWANSQLAHPDKAVEFSQQALAIAREVRNRRNEGDAINVLANAYMGLGDFAKAAEYLQEYLALSREMKDRGAESSALNNLGVAYKGMFKSEKAIDFFEQTLVLVREQKNRQTEALIFRNLGESYSQINRLDKAVENYELALPIYREIKDRQGEALVLGPLANVYDQLGRHEKSIEYFTLALPINREFKNYFRIAGNLMGLGNANLTLAKFETAIAYYEQALSVARENKIRSQEGLALSNIGSAYSEMSQYDKAIEYLQQGLVIDQELKNLHSEIHTLGSLGDAYHGLGKYDLAVRYHEQSLRIARQIRGRLREGQALYDLMDDWRAQNKPALAIFFGKQAVNLYQTIRSEIKKLDKASQQGFLDSNDAVYRVLADVLISQGRLPEAEQVIRMLKDEEYNDFVRGDEGASVDLKTVLTPDETALEKQYRELAEQLAAIGTERGVLLGKKSRTPEEEKRLAKLDADLAVAGNAFQKFLDQLEAKLGTSTDANAKVFALRESQGLMEDLRELGKGTVALYTLVSDDKYRVILTTADFQKGYEYPIKGADLNRKVLEFREVLQNPKYDPLPLAQELYKILVGPVAKDLKAAKAETVMWSLDGVLRYVPMAALNDGKKYLVEQYQNVVFTPASQPRLKDVPARNWNALGLGVSKAQGEGIPALPGVIDEMHGIIREETATTAPGRVKQLGVLPGVVEMDEQFTQDTMLTQLRRRPKVVHIASHFQFSPGNETNSALLLGDGTFLSLAQIKSLPNIFGGVDLLTLSACNTATGGTGANGKEVEGFAVLAQRQGAKAVVASLWPVADRSTKELMQNFYRLREATNDTTKAEALRQAQLRLLQGAASAENATTGLALDRQLIHEEDKAGGAKKLPFKPDARRPYAHPYYWAPFILIGNWR